MAFSEDEMNAAQEQINSFARNLEELNKTLASMSNVNSNYNRTVTQSSNSSKTNTESVNASSNALDNYRQSVDRVRNSEEKRKESLDKAGRVMDSFISATLSTETGITKYTETLTSSIDAIALALGALAITMGARSPIVIAITAFASILNSVIGGSLKMAESSLKARDSLVKVGAAGAFTAEDIIEMGKSAKISTQELEVLIEPLKKLNVAVLSLGSNAASGMVKFTEVVSRLTDDEIQQYRRIGLEYNQLTESMADYVNLQYASGIQISSRFKTEDQLKKASLEYVDNLLELSRLTGKDIDTVKKEQQAALARENLQIHMFRLQEEGQRLMESSNEQDRERGRLMLVQAEQTNEFIANLKENAPAIAEGVGDYVAAGGIAVTEASQKIVLRFGEEFLPNINRMLSQGMLNQEEQGKIIQRSRELSANLLLSELGGLMTISENVRKLLGVGEEATQQIIATRNQTFNEARNLVEQQLALQRASAGIIANFQANSERNDRINRLVAQGFYEMVNGPLMSALNFLSDAARGAARALSLLSPEGRERLREEDERERQRVAQQRQREMLDVMINDITTQNPNMNPEQLSTKLADTIKEEIAKNESLLAAATERYRASQEKSSIGRTNIDDTTGIRQAMDDMERARNVIDTLNEISKKIQNGQTPTNPLSNNVSQRVETPVTPDNVPVTPNGQELVAAAAAAEIAREEEQRVARAAVTQNPSATTDRQEEVSLLMMVNQQLSDMLDKLDYNNNIQDRILRNTA